MIMNVGLTAFEIGRGRRSDGSGCNETNSPKRNVKCNVLLN